MDKFYNNIIYQKKAIAELEECLKKDYFKKRVLCVFSSQAKKEHMTQIVNALNRANCVYSTLVLDRTPFLSATEIQEIVSTKSRAYDLVLGIGGGQCSDATKLLAKKYYCPSIFVASNFGNMSYFNCFAVVERGDEVVFEFAFSHSKVYIDESWVKNFDYKNVVDSIMFLSSFSGVMEDLQFYKLVFDQESPFDIDKLKKLLVSIKNQINEMSNDDEKKLKLMDEMIEVAYILKDAQIECFNFIKMANILKKLLKKRGVELSFSRLCYLSALTLQKCYQNFYNIKNIQLFEPYKPDDSYRLVRKFGIKISSLKKDESKYYYHKNKLFFQKINAIKHKLAKFSSNMREDLLRVPDKIAVGSIDGGDLFDSVKIMSMMYDSGMVVGLIKRSGLFNN